MRTALLVAALATSLGMEAAQATVIENSTGLAAPAEQRQTFWRERVENDPALAAIRRGAEYFRLAQQYGRAGL